MKQPSHDNDDDDSHAYLEVTDEVDDVVIRSPGDRRRVQSDNELARSRTFSTLHPTGARSVQFQLPRRKTHYTRSDSLPVNMSLMSPRINISPDERSSPLTYVLFSFYRAMHFSAKRGIAIA